MTVSFLTRRWAPRCGRRYLLALLTVMLVCASLLFGCNNSSDSSSSVRSSAATLGAGGPPKPFAWTPEHFDQPFVALASTRPSVTGSLAPGWVDGSSRVDADVTYRRVAGRNGGVAQAMFVTAVRSDQAQISHPVAFVAGWRYEAIVWVKGTGNASVTLQQGDAPYATFGEAAVRLTDTWQRVRVTALIKVSGNGNLSVNASDSAEIAFDDVGFGAMPMEEAAVIGTKISSHTFGIHEGRIADMALRNPGFEGEGVLVGNGKSLETKSTISGFVQQGWEDNSRWADVDVTYQVDEREVHRGSHSQRIEVGAVRSGEVQFVQNMQTRTPASLRFSEWVKGTQGASGRLEIRQHRPPYDVLASTNFIYDDTWKMVMVEAKLDKSSSEFSLSTSMENPGRYWVDDAVLVDPSTGAKPDWIPAPSVGGTMRLWDTGTTWSQLEPQRGKWDFSVLDRFIRLAESRQQDIVLTLGQSPAWASKDTSEMSYNGMGSVYGPKSIDDWRNMVRVITTRYKGRIGFYEIWNEPNDPNFAKLTMPELIDLTRVASQEIRAVDKDAKVIAASPYSVGYLDAYLHGGAAQYVDIIGYHEYLNEPEGMLADLSNVRYTLKDYNVALPLWMTEGGTGDETQNETASADGLLRWNLVSLAAGMERAFWYTWGAGIDISSSTIEPGSWKPNAAFRALADMQKRLTGRTLTKVRADTNTGQWLMEFTDAKGQVLTAAWTRGGRNPDQPVVWK